MEAAWLNSRVFAPLHLARAVNTCVLHMRTSDPHSSSLSEYFAPHFGAFVSVLGRPLRSGELLRMVEDAQRMNTMRRHMLAETPEICVHLWLVLFIFVEWACDALLYLIFSTKRSSLSPLAEYPYFYFILLFIGFFSLYQ
jgi:hypothetical protein